MVFDTMMRLAEPSHVERMFVAAMMMPLCRQSNAARDLAGAALDESAADVHIEIGTRDPALALLLGQRMSSTPDALSRRLAIEAVARADRLL